MTNPRVQAPPVNLKDRIAAFQQRNVSQSSVHSSKTPSPNSGLTLRDKIAQFEQKGGIPVPRGSFGLGAANPENSQVRRRGELYGNRVPGLSAPNGPPLSRSGSPLPTGIAAKTRRFSISDMELERSPSPNGRFLSSMFSETEESPMSSPNTDNSQRCSPSPRSTFATALNAARRRESMDLSKFDLDLGLPSPSPSSSPSHSPSHTRYLPSMALVEDQEEDAREVEMLGTTTPLEDTPPAPAIFVSSEEDLPAITGPDVIQEAGMTVRKESPPIEMDAEASFADFSPRDIAGSPSTEVSKCVQAGTPDDEVTIVVDRRLLSPVQDSSSDTPTQGPLATGVQQEHAVSDAGAGREVSPSTSDLEAPLAFEPIQSDVSEEHSNSGQTDVDIVEEQEHDGIEIRTPTVHNSVLDLSTLPSHVVDDEEASPVLGSTSSTVVTRPSSVTASEETSVEAEATSIKAMDDSITDATGSTQIPILNIYEISPTSTSSLVNSSPPQSPSPLRAPSLGRRTPSSEVSITPSITPTVSMFEASEVGVSRAHRTTMSTSRAVHIPAVAYLHEEDPIESEYGSVSILPHSQSASNIPSLYSEPDLTANVNDPSKSYFKAVVHGKVTERATMSTSKLPSTPQMARVRRLIKAGEAPQSPGNGDLEMLLADAAKLEKSLMEGHIPSEESDGEGQSTNASEQNHSTSTDTESTDEKPPTPPPKPHKTSRYLSSGLRKLKKTSSNVLRTMPGAYPRQSMSTSSEISSEDSTLVVTPPTDLGKDVQSGGSGVGWPSMSPKKPGSLSRASSFADKILHRTRTKSSTSSLDVPANSTLRGRSLPLPPIFVPPMPTPVARPAARSSSLYPQLPPKDGPQHPPLSPPSPSLSPNSVSARPKSWMSGASTSSSTSGPLILDNNVFDAFPSVPQDIPPSPNASASVFSTDASHSASSTPTTLREASARRHISPPRTSSLPSRRARLASGPRQSSDVLHP